LETGPDAMIDESVFADRIRARYPEGLTGLFAIGGTRTQFILENNRNSPNPGSITNLHDYTSTLLRGYFDFARMFFSLGGQNMVITALGFESFFQRGDEYAQFIAISTLSLINEEATDYYHALDADPYFIGVDTLLLLPASHPAHELGASLVQFMEEWKYDDSRRKMLWEIASIPLLTLWRAHDGDSSSNDQLTVLSVNQPADLVGVQSTYYEFFARFAYGAHVPRPHFYLGTNRNGDLKLRTVLPAGFIGGSDCRLYFTPYPSLMMTHEVLQVLLEDLAFGEQKLRSRQMDYKDRYTPELAEAEYQRFRGLADDPSSILGLSRNTRLSSDPD
jgi:hypothetical protein